MNQLYCPYCMNPIQPNTPCPTCGLTQGSYHPQPHQLPPGTVLAGRYLLGRVLGEGGFGITYIGCDTRLDLKVAVKEYFPHAQVTRDCTISQTVQRFNRSAGRSFDHGLERFIREAKALARMDKTPEIVAVRDFLEANGTAYIVMEYVDGTTFKELVTQNGGAIPADRLLTLIKPLFAALEALHKQNLIHRDISPDNLMLESGKVRLLDFGCARESLSGAETMTIVLKQGFSPIEQYQHKGQGPWTDVYSLAATIYYCITGRIPPQPLDRLIDEELIPPRKLGANLTQQEEAALLYGMGLQPTRRFQSIRDFYLSLYEGVPIPHRPAKKARRTSQEEVQMGGEVGSDSPSEEGPGKDQSIGDSYPTTELPVDNPSGRTVEEIVETWLQTGRTGIPPVQEYTSAAENPQEVQQDNPEVPEVESAPAVGLQGEKEEPLPEEPALPVEEGPSTEPDRNPPVTEGGEPVQENPPTGEEPVLVNPPERKKQSHGPKKWLIGVGAAAVLAVGIGVVAISGQHFNPSGSLGSPNGTESPAITETVPPEKVKITVSDTAAFLSALEDDNVKSIVIGSGAFIEINNALEVNKPVTLAEGSKFFCHQPISILANFTLDAGSEFYSNGDITLSAEFFVSSQSGATVDDTTLTVTADAEFYVESLGSAFAIGSASVLVDGGDLTVDGYFSSANLVRTVNGGSIATGPYGNMELTTLWLANPNDLTGRGQVSAQENRTGG